MPEKQIITEPAPVPPGKPIERPQPPKAPPLREPAPVPPGKPIERPSKPGPGVIPLYS